MPQVDRIQPFTKMNGAGNDFVVIDNREEAVPPDALERYAPFWCDRKRGIGADGVLALLPPSRHKSDFRMLYLNADGSRATMCGNGARCIARFARRLGLEPQPLIFETDAGMYKAFVPSNPTKPVKLYVPPPRDLRLHDLVYDEHDIHYVWTGTHHLVLETEDLSRVDVSALGRRLRHHERYQPEGTNVNFVKVDGDSSVSIRTFEKGVEAETEACGSGAIASAIVATELGLVAGQEIRVRTQGGLLKVGVAEPSFLEGPAETSFTGEITIDKNSPTIK